VLPAAAGATTVSSDDLAHCARIATRDARLECYDTLAQRPPDAAPPASARRPASAPPPAPASATPAADDPKSFGLSPVQRRVAVTGPKEESAHIVSMAVNQAGHSTIVLDSGQTWTVLDDDGWLSSGDQVTIKHATLGSYLLIAPSHHTYKVHRTQ
jgi:hypothetical protein